MTYSNEAKVAADKARETTRKTAATVEQFAIDGEVPETIRALARKNIAQTQELYEGSKDVLEALLESWEKTFGAAGQGVAALNRKVIDMTQRNVNSGFDFANSLTGAKTVAEAIDLHWRYWRNQLDTLETQTEEVREFSNRVTADIFEPLR